MKYQKIVSLEEVAKKALKDVPPGESINNYIVACRIDISDLLSKPLLDVQEQARNWGAKECPDHLYFNHGQYAKEGVDYIAEELKRKPTSNRALYSLINQNDIEGSGDNPIPSFMVFQAVLRDSCLYCTVYFRALEISSFFRINLEEIRQNIKKIYSHTLVFNSVKILILGCRAHHTVGFIPLVRPKLDQLDTLDILSLLENSRKELGMMIREKSNAHSVVESKSLEELLACIHKRDIALKKREYIISLLSESIALSKEVAKMRERQSHDQELERLSSVLSKKLSQLAEELEF
ncbi:hypothetical protein [Larsenimonas rhizosphaerae]|uniref:Uncharacterized protein n=1 Tax=Larsenimonas rhizosphaerae TaxID=2944682 RepID=A0AA41ZDV7_9GAMM|nr:hypothetical protein [Larsenimonas rhizosphaerae]MCX2522736.1 hypothetical protein [Larsenimonas rhizosphaerae]